MKLKTCKGCGKKFTPVAAFPESEYCNTGCMPTDKKSSTLYIEINPVGKPRMTRRDKWNPSDAAIRYWNFKDELVKEAKKQGFILGDSYSVIFNITMPQSWSKKKKLSMIGTAHQAKPDLDNLLKAINDSLRPDDDSGVYRTLASKYWMSKGSILISNEINY